MKNVLKTTWWALFAFTFPAAAQTGASSPALQDTLVIQLQGQNQVQLIGNSFQELAAYEKADSLTQLFMADLDQAFAAHQFDAVPKRVHYLVSPDGRRRLKAEIAEEETRFDLAFEKRRLSQNLPPLQYVVYDLCDNVQLHYYLTDTTALRLLKNTTLKPALRELAQEEKELKKNYRYTLEKQGDAYVTLNKAGNRTDEISAEPLAGVMLLGNQLSPLVGLDVNLTLQNKYKIPSTRFGIGYSAFVLTDYTDGNFSNIRPGEMLDLSVAFNSSRREGKSYWYGVQVGAIKESKANFIKDSRLKFGFFNRQGEFTFGVDFIDADKKNDLMLFYVKKTF